MVTEMMTPAAYEWRDGPEGKMDWLFRDNLRIGEVAAMGQLWVSTLLRPSRITPGAVDRETSAVKSAVIGRSFARATTLKNARFFWDGIILTEDEIEETSIG
jgi:hypothetical protein